MNKIVPLIAINILAVLSLVSLILAPIYFATHITKIAGLKSQSQFLIVSQVEKFPGMKLTQVGNIFEIEFEKYAQSQAFLSVLILNNPTNESKTYSLQTHTGPNKVFFGEDLINQPKTINVPSLASVPISFQSPGQEPKVSIEVKVQ